MFSFNMLSWMIAGHMAGDYIFQTGWMAQKKQSNPLALLIHSLVYTAAIFLFVLPDHALPWYSILLVFASHALIDQRSFVRWWCRRITKSEGIPWLVIVTDQSWHIIVLAAVCLIDRRV